MQRFIKLILLFAAPILLFFAAGEWYVEHLPNPARDKHEWMTAHHDDVTTLILGDSHAFYGIRPDQLADSAYSLAMTSQTLRYDDFLLHHYPMPRLRDVVLSISYFTLWEDFESLGGQDHLISRYHIYMGCRLHHAPQYYLECVHRREFIERLRSLYKPSQLSWDALGWGDNYTLDRKATDWDNGAQRAADNTYTDTAVVSLNEDFLLRIISYCRSNGVRLTLVGTPTTASFRQHEAPRQLDVNSQVLRRILRQHPEVQYLDYEADPDFGPDDFYDSDHLTDVGASRLTKKIRQHLSH